MNCRVRSNSSRGNKNDEKSIRIEITAHDEKSAKKAEENIQEVITTAFTEVIFRHGCIRSMKGAERKHVLELASSDDVAIAIGKLLFYTALQLQILLL